jgi:hypothetical protein
MSNSKNVIRIPSSSNVYVLLLMILPLPCSLLFASLYSSLAFDELAHFTGGVILARNQDAGYFKVNPPANKWITAGCTFLFSDLNLPKVEHSSSFSNLTRPEFDAGDALLELNRDGSLLPALVISRLARIPFFLLASWMLWRLTNSWPNKKRMLCQLLWCTSPLMLGHGSIVSADALCGVAMCFILWTTAGLWKHPNWFGFAVSGMAWGSAIGTKFTFGPLYLAYPIAVHLCAANGWTSSIVRRISRHDDPQPVSLTRRLLIVVPFWCLHAIMACLVVNSLYLFHETAMPIGKHDFIGMTFSAITKPAESDWEIIKQVKSTIGKVASPFPRSFLEGVDQQMADMDRPRGAYLLGRRIEGEIHWFFLVGYAMKEQLAVLLGAALGLVGLVARKNYSARSSRTLQALNSASASGSVQATADDSLRSFCAFFLLVFGLFMATQSNLVWNVRYLILALPMIYLLVAYYVPSFEVQWWTKRKLLKQSMDCHKPSKSARIDLVFATLFSVCIIEFGLTSPHHFSYINPLFGGAYRVPIALNDSNFDYGQDLFYARDWIVKQRANTSESDPLKLYAALSGHGTTWFEEAIEPVNMVVLQKAIQSKHEATARSADNSSRENMTNILLVSRGLFHPEPWAVRNTKLKGDFLEPEELKLVQELLLYEPDVWITPVVVGYRLSQ